MFLAVIYVLFSANYVDSASISPQIIGGVKTTIITYPYQLALLNGDLSIICGASILSNNYALTAAHCTNNYRNTPTVLSIRGGSTFWRSGGLLRNVSGIVQHPDYNANSQDFDISVLTLVTGLTYSNYVKAIGLAASFPPVGTMATVTGWGQESDTSQVASNQLKVTRLPFQSATVCKKLTWGDMMTVNMFCAGYYNASTSTCHGDSGGPLVYNGKLIGVVSFGETFCTSVPIVFTNVPLLSDWIRQNAVVDVK